MNTSVAAALLSEIETYGATIRPDGPDLVCKFQRRPPEPLLAKLKAHKAEVIAFLTASSQHQPGVWSAADWAAFFHERAGIREHDGRQTRQEAERQALAETVEHWRALHPMPPSGPEIGCVHCCRGAGDPNLVPHLAAHRGAFWLHNTCWPEFDRARQEEAVAALRRLIPTIVDEVRP